MSETSTATHRRGLLARAWRDWLGPQLGWLVLALILMAIEGSILGLLSWLVQPMFDDVFVAGDGTALIWIGALLFGLFVVRAGAGLGQRVLIARVGLDIAMGMQRRLVGHLVHLDTAFFAANAPGTLIERVRGDTEALRKVAGQALMTIGRDGVTVIALLVVALAVDWRWTLIVFLAGPLLILPVLAVQRWIRATTRAARASAARLSMRLDEIFHGIQAIKLNTAEAAERDRYGAETAAFRAAQLRSETGQAAMPALVDMAAAVGIVAVLAFGAAEILAGDKTLGQFMSFFTALALMFDPLRKLSAVGGQIQAALASLERIYGLLDQRATILDPPRPVAPAIGPAPEIRLEDVHFAYAGQPALNGLSLVAPGGRVTALVGPSGAGKSTVFHLLTRLVEPQSGRVTVAGYDVRDFRLDALRRLFAVVSQDAALFDATIAENVAFGRPGADAAAIAAALDRAEMAEALAGFPGGAAAPAGPRGSNLSGGQRQRVAIARAILRDAPILLLDEATSALDTMTEARVQAALEAAGRGRTTIVIAHRLSTVERADLVHVLDRGRVIESGSHAALLARNGAYARLHRALA